MPYENGDEAAVFGHVVRWENDEHDVIPDGAARVIASWWHSPSVYDEPITALSHTGLVMDGILDNIDRNLRDYPKSHETNNRALRSLRAYCEKRIAENDTDARPGWSNMWVR